MFARGIRTRAPRGGLLALLLVGALSLGAGAAWAYWTAVSTAGSNGASAATSVNAAATPTVSATGSSVTVSWAASTLATGQAVTGYQVKRYDAGTNALQTILSACAGTVTGTSCVESAVPAGQWKYTITPVFATNWRGAESGLSAAVYSDSTAPTNSVTLSSVTGGAWKTGTTVYYRGAATGSFSLTNAVVDGGSGPASSQTAPLGGTTTGWSHTPSTVSTPAGGPYVSAPFSWAAATTSSPTEAVTGRDAAGNTAVTNLSFVDDSTAPTAGTISYVNGSTLGSTVSVTFTTGIDAGTGIASRVLQRADATLSGIVCGSYSAFSTVVGGTNPTSPLVDTVAADHCYQYRYVVTDQVGNSHTATSASVAHSPYGAYWALDAGTGTTAVDSTANANTGTLQATAGWGTGRFGASGLALTGASTSWVSVTNPVVDTSESYSVAAWVKLNSLTGAQTFASIDGTNVSPFYFQLIGGRFRMSQTATDSTSSGGADVLGIFPTTGTWYHLVGVYNKTANTVQLYVNGALQGTTTATTAWKANGNTSIGRARYGAANVDYVNGTIDEVYFYDTALTQADVTALRGPFGAYWAFDAGTGTTAIDSSGHQHTGTLQAAATWTTGKVGTNALSLTGAATSYVDVITPVVDTSESYSVASWVKLNSLTGFQSFASVDGAAISPFYLQLAGGAFRFAQYATDGTGSTFVGVNGLSPTTGTWYHVVGVYNKTASTIELFVNGVSQGSTTATTAWRASGHTAIGHARWAAANVDFVNGALDEVRFYDRAITQTEIADLAGSYTEAVTGTTGLLNYWRLGEASPATAMDDITAANNNGTYVNTPTTGVTGVITGDANTAVQFDGVDDYATAARQIAGNFSIELWFKSTQAFSSDFGQAHCNFWWQGAGLIDADVSGAANDFGISLCDGRVIAGAGSPEVSIFSGTGYNTGTWHHVVFTRVQATGAMTLYIDGVSVGTATGPTTLLNSNASINIGRSAAGVNYFAGTIDEVAVYTTVLTVQTIRAHYYSAP